MTATANLTALRAAAVSGDRVAMLLLADVAEAGMDDDQADAWRWLADPPAEGWERRACGVLAGFPGEVICPLGWVRAFGGPAFRRLEVHLRWNDAGPRMWAWDDGRGWHLQLDPDVPRDPPPAVRGAALTACRKVLAG